MCEFLLRPSVVERMTNDCLLMAIRYIFLTSFVHTSALYFCSTILHPYNEAKRFYPKKSHTNYTSKNTVK
jgi:hypothetical protein